MASIVSTRIIQCPDKDPDPDIILQAVEVIRSGGLLVYPTDTFYGLGADPRNVLAVQRIFQVKGRTWNKPLPVIIGHMGGLKRCVANIPPISMPFIELFWPGALTIIFPAAPDLPSILTAGTGRIGVRWPKSYMATAIAKKAETAIISTSANLSGRGGIMDPKRVIRDLNGMVDLIIDSGVLPPSRGSTIVDPTCDPVKIIRAGDIPRARFEAILDKDK